MNLEAIKPNKGAAFILHQNLNRNRAAMGNVILQKYADIPPETA